MYPQLPVKRIWLQACGSQSVEIAPAFVRNVKEARSNVEQAKPERQIGNLWRREC